MDDSDAKRRRALTPDVVSMQSTAGPREWPATSRSDSYENRCFKSGWRANLVSQVNRPGRWSTCRSEEHGFIAELAESEIPAFLRFDCRNRCLRSKVFALPCSLAPADDPE